MKFSTKVRYGIRAMIEIAKSDDGTGVFQKDIAANQSISIKYLDHIISALKVAGLVTNAHGKKSGYILTRAPKDITILEIHNAFNANLSVIDCIAQGNCCERENECETKDFWQGLNNIVSEYFNSHTLEDLKNESV